MKNQHILLIKFTILITLSCALSFYSNDESLPFGMNHSISPHLPLTKVENRNKYKESMDSSVTLGIKWWRATGQFGWNAVEPNQSKPYDFSIEDSLVRWCGERNLHLLPNIGYTAEWARHPDIRDDHSFYFKKYPPDPKYWVNYENYVKALVERYDGDGFQDFKYLKIPIKHWECMNEPYHKYGFAGTPDQYIEMFKKTRRAIKVADSEAKILGPCLTIAANKESFKWTFYNTNTIKKGLSNILFPSDKNALQYIIDGLGSDSIDIISYHIYRRAKSYMESYRKLRDFIGNKKDIWITESGYQNSDNMSVETDKQEASDPTRYVIYDGSTSFKAALRAFWAGGDTIVVRTLLDSGRQVRLVPRNNNSDTFLIKNYLGGPLIYKNKDTILNIGDTLEIFDKWSDSMTSNFKPHVGHNTKRQAKFYGELLDSLISDTSLFKNLKVFFFCADNYYNKQYYPPIIEFGKGKRPKYFRQYKRYQYAIFDSTGKKYPAADTIKAYLQNYYNSSNMDFPNSNQ